MRALVLRKLRTARAGLQGRSSSESLASAFSNDASSCQTAYRFLGINEIAVVSAMEKLGETLQVSGLLVIQPQCRVLQKA